MMFPLYRFLKTQLSQDVPAVASFPSVIAAVLGKVYIYISAKYCFLKENYKFITVLQKHTTTEIRTFFEHWNKIKFSVIGIKQK